MTRRRRQHSGIEPGDRCPLAQHLIDDRGSTKELDVSRAGNAGGTLTRWTTQTLIRDSGNHVSAPRTTRTEPGNHLDAATTGTALLNSEATGACVKALSSNGRVQRRHAALSARGRAALVCALSSVARGRALNASPTAATIC